MKPVRAQDFAIDRAMALDVGSRRDPDGWASRCAAMGLTAGIHIAVLLGLVITLHAALRPTPPAPVPLVVTSLPLAAPAEPNREIPPGPRQIERKQEQAETPHPAPPELVLPHATPIVMPIEKQADPVDPGPPAPKTSAPEAVTAPPAPQASSDSQRTWEALLLAHLRKYRRYPASARTRHLQGIAYVRFRMDRAGHVLSVALVRSSGSADLDREAMATVQRAAPLPPIPRDKPDELDLSVPIEFFLD